MEKSSSSWKTHCSHNCNRTCIGVFICHLLQYCGIKCRCMSIKCLCTNRRKGWIANRTSSHATSRATRKKDGVIHKADTLEKQRPHFSRKKIVYTPQVSPSRQRPEHNRPRRRSHCRRVSALSATYLPRVDPTYVPWSCVEHTSDRCRQPCARDDSG